MSLVPRILVRDKLQQESREMTIQEIRACAGMAERISNIEQGISNYEVEIAAACFAGLAMTF